MTWEEQENAAHLKTPSAFSGTEETRTKLSPSDQVYDTAHLKTQISPKILNSKAKACGCNKLTKNFFSDSVVSVNDTSGSITMRRLEIGFARISHCGTVSGPMQ